MLAWPGRERLASAEYDHIVPLALGGGNTPDNWAALCQRCHANKTKLDLKRIAKTVRQRRYHETGRSRAPRLWSPLGEPRRFDATRSRRLNGMVTARCKRARCKQPTNDAPDVGPCRCEE